MSFKLLEKILPNSLFQRVYKKITQYKIYRNKSFFNKKIKELKKKEVINVAFIIFNSDTWKYHELYKLLDSHEKYNPFMIICPHTNRGDEFLEKNYYECVDLCKTHGYHFVHGYNIVQKNIIEVKSKLDIGIVFFSNPNQLTSDYFTLQGFKDVLTCYVPYSFRIDRLYEYTYNSVFVNLIWRNFYESKAHKTLAYKYALNKGNNVIVSGFPKIDELRNIKYKSIKSKVNTRKKIIWAPHWTIKGHQYTGLDWSCFLDYNEIIYDLAIQYSDKIEIVLKPHPFLFNLLEKSNLWGKKKTDVFIDKWQNNDNTSILYGDYVDLFASSDALIHDSGSFAVEYLVFDKPVGYTISNRSDFENRFNELGKLAIDQHEKIHNKEELVSFINKVIQEADDFSETRLKFVDEYLHVNNNSAAQNILTELNNHLT
jgi:hypothetical protein